VLKLNASKGNDSEEIMEFKYKKVGGGLVE